MSKILDNMEVEGYQESTTVIVCGDAFGSANDAAAACLKSHGSDPEGETFQFKAVSLDQANDTRWLTVVGDYTLDGAESKFENCRAVDSSSGALSTLPFDFGGSLGAETIRIYGCVSHEDFDAVDTLQSDVVTLNAQVAGILSPATGVVAYLTSNEAIASGVQEQLDTFTEVVDYGSDFNAATGVYTVPTTGMYEVTFQAFHDAAADQLVGSFILNGATEVGRKVRTVRGQYDHVRAYAVFSATAGDLLSFEVRNYSGASDILSGISSTYVVIRPW
jgi:hypothetical protein